MPHQTATVPLRASRAGLALLLALLWTMAGAFGAFESLHHSHHHVHPHADTAGSRAAVERCALANRDSGPVQSPAGQSPDFADAPVLAGAPDSRRAPDSPGSPDAEDESMCLVCTLAIGLLQPSTPVQATGPRLTITLFLRPMASVGLALPDFPLYSQHERAPPAARA